MLCTGVLQTPTQIKFFGQTPLSSDSSDRSAPSDLSNNSNYYYKYEKIIFNLIVQFSSKIV